MYKIVHTMLSIQFMNCQIPTFIQPPLYIYWWCIFYFAIFDANLLFMTIVYMQVTSTSRILWIFVLPRNLAQLWLDMHRLSVCLVHLLSTPLPVVHILQLQKHLTQSTEDGCVHVGLFL